MKKSAINKHRVRGYLLKQIRESLISVNIDLGNSYSKNSELYQAVEKCIKEVDSLRSRLDDLVGIEYPEFSDSELNRIYYGVADERELKRKLEIRKSPARLLAEKIVQDQAKKKKELRRRVQKIMQVASQKNPLKS